MVARLDQEPDHRDDAGDRSRAHPRSSAPLADRDLPAAGSKHPAVSAARRMRPSNQSRIAAAITVLFSRLAMSVIRRRKQRIIPPDAPGAGAPTGICSVNRPGHWCHAPPWIQQQQRPHGIPPGQRRVRPAGPDRRSGCPVLRVGRTRRSAIRHCVQEQCSGPPSHADAPPRRRQPWVGDVSAATRRR